MSCKKTDKKVKITVNKKIKECVVYVNKKGTKFVKINNEYKYLSSFK